MGELTKAERIAAARQALADRRTADPASVERYEGRMARLNAAAKRERERYDTLVLGRRPAAPPLPPKPKGMSRAAWKLEKARLREEAAASATLAAKWSHKQGTPETLEHASTAHSDCLDQMVRNGSLDREQREWAAEIANVYRSIEGDVAVKIASLEARVDQSRSGSHLVAEGVRRVRLHHAYTLWRDVLPAPKQLVLDMIVGEQVGYTVAARRYGVHPRRARRELVAALDRWPDMVDAAHRLISREDVEALNAAAE